MNHQTWYLTLTCLVLVTGIFECREYLSSSQDIQEGHNSQQGNDVCCDPDLMQSINSIFQEAKVDDFDILVEKFNELKSGLEYTAPDDIKDYIFSNLQKTACGLVKESKYGTCSCDSPVVRKMIGERMENITMMHITYTNELSELKEILNELNIPEDHPIEGESIEKQLKDLVCRQCKGLRDQKFMLECQQLINIGKTSEEKKLEVMEHVVKFIQVRVRTLSRQAQEINSAAENAMESMKETINQLIQTATDNNVTNCDEVFEVTKPNCNNLPAKCNKFDITSCTIDNCEDQCKVNCCNGDAVRRCRIPTCISCRNKATNYTCNANIVSQCAGRSTDNSQNRVLIDQIEGPETEIQDLDLGAGCSSLPAKCDTSNKASCTLNNCKDQCKVNCCNGASNKKCTIPTCKSCKDATATTTCNSNTASQCAGFSTHNYLNEILNEIYKLQDQIEESEIEIEIRDPDLGESCGKWTGKCNPINKADCTLNNCKDQCKVNCCNGDTNKKCRIPTCKDCKDATAIATCNANTASKCAGFSTHNGLNEILNEIYKLQDQIEESEIEIEIRGM